MLWINTDKANLSRENLPAEWKIDLIEDLTESEAAEMAETHEVIKGHDIYFIDFGGYFKFSYLVFLNGHHIRYAGDYELHHNDMTKEKLYDYYRKSIKKKLYTERELGHKLKNYHDYKARMYYLQNYYCDLENHISRFGSFNDPEYTAAWEKATKNLHYSEVCFGYYENKEFVEKCSSLYAAVEAAREKANNDFDYWRKAFRYEFSNYECIYGGRYLEAAYAATNGEKFNEVQKRAYKAAMKEYEEYCFAHDMP